MYDMLRNYGEFVLLGGWGILLVLMRRIVFGKLCKESVTEGNGTSRMRKAMTLKFEKSHEVHVEIMDIPIFVQKYFSQERRLGVRLFRWKRLPERWTDLIAGVGFLEGAVFHYLGYGTTFCVDRFLMGISAAVVVRMAILWFETDSLWEQAVIGFQDYIANSLQPRQHHVYETFEEPAAETQKAEEKTAEASAGKSGQKKEPALNQEEEKLFQEMLTDFLGTST